MNQLSDLLGAEETRAGPCEPVGCCIQWDAAHRAPNLVYLPF